MRLTIHTLLLALPVLAAIPVCAAERYEIDPVHSSVTFRVKHLFSYVNGRFNDVHGSIAGDPAAPEETQVDVSIKTESIDTHEPKRDDHLRSPEFFDAAQFPEITFKSKKVNVSGNDSAFVTGDLTMHGVTKEAILQAKYLGKGPGPDGRLHTGWEGKTALKRSDFGLTWSKTIEGTQLVGDDIEINLEIDAVQAKEGVAGAGEAPPVPPAPEKPNTPPTGTLAIPGSPLPPGLAPLAPPIPGAPVPPPVPAPATPPQVLAPGAPLTPPAGSIPAIPPNAGEAPRSEVPPTPILPPAPGATPVPPPPPKASPPGNLPKSA